MLLPVLSLAANATNSGADNSGPASGFYNASGGAGAPTNSNFLTTGGFNTLLTDERQITVVAPLTGVDGGAKNYYTLGITNSIAGGLTGATTQVGAADNILNYAGKATGDLVYYNGTHWVRLPIGTVNQFLQVTAGIPTWTTASASGASTGDAFITIGNPADLSAERAITAGTGIIGTDGGAGTTYTIAIDTTVVATTSNSVTLTNKTLTSPVFGWNSGNGVTLKGSTHDNILKWADWGASAGNITLPLVNGTVAANIVLDHGAQTFANVMTFTASPVLSTNTFTTSGGHTVTFPDSTDTFLTVTGTQAGITNKTFTAPQITSASTLTFLQVSGNYILSAAANNPAATRTYSWYDAGGNGDIAIKSGTPTAGGIAYADGGKILFSAAGTPGQLLQSNGASAPSWVAPGMSFGGNGTDGALNLSGSLIQNGKTYYATTLTGDAHNCDDCVFCATSTITSFSNVSATGWQGGRAQTTASEQGLDGFGPAFGGGGDKGLLTSGPKGGGGGGGFSGGGTGGGTQIDNGGPDGSGSFPSTRCGSGGGSGGTGAAGSSNAAGRGGSTCRFYAGGAVTAGTVHCNGFAGGNGATLAGGSGGGGAGSSWWFSLVSINLGSSVTATGGDGGNGVGANNGGGGGGGGGFVFQMSPSNSGTANVARGSGGTGTNAGTQGADGTQAVYTQTPTLPTIVYCNDVAGVYAQAHLERGRKWMHGEDIKHLQFTQREGVTWLAAFYAKPGHFNDLCYLMNYGGTIEEAVAQTSVDMTQAITELRADPTVFQAFPPVHMEAETCDDTDFLRPAA